MSRPPSWEEASRELLLSCDLEGNVTAADARALRALGDELVGRRLAALAPPGVEDKVAGVLRRAAHEEVHGAELPLVSRGKVVTWAVSARREGSGLVLLASRFPEDHGAVLRQVHEVMEEVVALNRELTRSRRELEARTEELERTNRDLDESNRGVLALHAELADKAETLRRSADVKTRVVANVSHEFRTPLHTILGLSKLLLDGVDGPVTEEQAKQLRFIRASAEELTELVDDLLDLSRAEAGKVMVRPSRTTAGELLAALRGALRPLAPHDGPVALRFEADDEDFALDTDAAKVSQIVRNLVSNALKFTAAGEVRVAQRRAEDRLVIAVSDTGIGIAPNDFERIFEEFGQVENPLQARVKGTGLGLPLSRKLAALLGGTLTVESAPGRGSTFTLSVPAVHPEVRELAALESRPLDPSRPAVLVVEDDRRTIFVYERYLAMSGYQVVPARSVDDARRLVAAVRPVAIVLDIVLEGETSWDLLAELKREPATADIPVLVVTVSNKEQKARALGADEFWLKPLDQERLLRRLRAIGPAHAGALVLAIDDDERSRYLLRRHLRDSPFRLAEAATGAAGVRAARDLQPSVILLDFLLDGMTAFDVLDELKADPRTRHIPVVIVTSHVLPPEERERLAAGTEAILSKESLSRELALSRIRDALAKATASAPTP